MLQFVLICSNIKNNQSTSESIWFSLAEKNKIK